MNSKLAINDEPQLLIVEDLNLSRLSYNHFLKEVFKLTSSQFCIAKNGSEAMGAID